MEEFGRKIVEIREIVKNLAEIDDQVEDSD